METNFQNTNSEVSESQVLTDSRSLPTSDIQNIYDFNDENQSERKEDETLIISTSQVLNFNQTGVDLSDGEVNNQMSEISLVDEERTQVQNQLELSHESSDINQYDFQYPQMDISDIQDQSDSDNSEYDFMPQSQNCIESNDDSSKGSTHLEQTETQRVLEDSQDSTANQSLCYVVLRKTAEKHYESLSETFFWICLCTELLRYKELESQLIYQIHCLEYEFGYTSHHDKNPRNEREELVVQCFGGNMLQEFENEFLTEFQDNDETNQCVKIRKDSLFSCCQHYQSKLLSLINS